MPFISDTQLARVNQAITAGAEKAKRIKAKAEEKSGQALVVAEVVGSAAAIGFIRGKMEESDGSWDMPLINFDAEPVIGLAMIGAGMFELFGKNSEHFVHAGSGVLAHYAGQIARKTAKTGKLTFVGKEPEYVGMNPEYVGGGLDSALANSV